MVIFTCISEQDGWERSVIGFIDNPKSDVITPVNKVKFRACSTFQSFSTQDHAAAAIAKAKTGTVFAWKGETL